MYLPNIIPSDIRTGWMQASSDRRINVNNSRNESSHRQHQQHLQQQHNMNSSINMKSRKSDYPPLSFYTPIRSNPLYLTNTSKHALSFLKNSKKSYNYNDNGNNNGQFNNVSNSTYYEGVEQLGLEIGCRLQTLKDNEIWGYTWLTPLGVDKTMAQLIEEANDEIEDNEDDNGNINMELQSAIDLVNNSANNINNITNNNNNINANGSNSFDLQNAGLNNNGHIPQGMDIRNATDMMSENYGQMRRHDASNEDSGSFNDNVSSRMNRAIYNNSDDARMFTDRDLDAEISNHDLSSSNIYFQGEYSDDDGRGVVYGDEENGDQEEEDDDDYEDDIGDHAYIEDDEDDDIADIRFAEDDDDNDVGENINEFNLGDQAIIDLQDEDGNEDETNNNGEVVDFHQILNFNQGSSSYPVNAGRTNKEYLDTAEEGYFMAYEDYQDDHSIIDAQVGKPFPKNVSILENPHTRGSFTSVRRNMNSRYTDSANLTTPTTLNSNIGNQTTGNTSVDNDDGHGSDLDMTLE